MNTQTTESTIARPKHLSRWVGGAVAAGVLAIGGFALAGSGGDQAPLDTTIDLALGSSNSMASCMIVDAAILADMPLAFGGTATSVDEETVTLDVDEWYVGGDADAVRLQAASGMEALIDGFTMVEGEEYLIAAFDGNVNFCGYSGPATPELQALYDEAFGS